MVKRLYVERINENAMKRVERIDRVELMRTFVRIVEAGSLSAAARQLATTQALPNDSLRAVTAESKDSLDMKPVVFDDAELGTILAQLSGFYHVKVEYVDAGAQHIRLFFNWNKTKTLEQNLEILNAFDRIQIEYIDGTLMVK